MTASYMATRGHDDLRRYRGLVCQRGPLGCQPCGAVAWLENNQHTLVTTDYVIDETLTLLRIRKEAPRALALGERLFSKQLAELYLIQEADLLAAWRTFRDFADKEWSFTDCTSKVVMQQLGLQTAFAFDQHFRQFGTVQVVP